MYSGLCLKTGDTFRRPVAAECLYVQISRSHSLLYKAFADLRKEINGDSHSGRDIEVASAIQEYISENQPAGPPYNPQNPSSEWRRVKFVRDFPMLDRMAKKEDGIPLFREPLRTISDQTIVSLCNEFDMRPFRFESQDSPREPQGASNKPPPGP